MSIATAAVKGGFFETNGVSSLQSMSGEDGQRRRLRKWLSGRGMLGFREIMFVLTGAAPGGVATKTIGQVFAAEELGGLRQCGPAALVNRATTAADVTEIQSEILRYVTKNTFGANPPPNLDRNPLGTR